MPQAVRSRLASSFARQLSQVQETAGQELLALVPQSPAWFEAGRRRAPAAISWIIADAFLPLGVSRQDATSNPERVLASLAVAKASGAP